MVNMSSKEILARKLVEIGGIRFGSFVLKSGRVSNYYVDIKYASTFPDVLKLIAEEVAKKVKGYDVMAGIELGAVPIMVATSFLSGIPYVIIRKKEKEYGIRDRIIGLIKEGYRAIVVEDVTTTGSSALEVINLLRDLNVHVDKVVCVVDREEGAMENLKREGIILDPVLTINEIMRIMNYGE